MTYNKLLKFIIPSRKILVLETRTKNQVFSFSYFGNSFRLHSQFPRTFYKALTPFSRRADMPLKVPPPSPDPEVTLRPRVGILTFRWQAKRKLLIDASHPLYVIPS